jgi:hypothetical protein
MMKMTAIVCGVVVVSAVSGANPRGQETTIRPTVALVGQGGGGGRGGVAGARVPLETKLVKGAPYFAEVVTESVQTLADGNRIVRKTTGRVYRDSQGRTRREDDREPGKVRTISIVDPVGGFSYSLNPEGKVALKTPYRTNDATTWRIIGNIALSDPANADLKRTVDAKVEEVRGQAASTATQGGRGGRGSGGATGPTATEEKIEKLAPRQIEGVMAEGVRTTRTIPAGAIGNEQPIAIVTEEWRSPELQVLVLTRTSDPRTGESTYRLLGIQRSEPNSSWFEVPGDYTMRDSGVGGFIRREQ